MIRSTAAGGARSFSRATVGGGKVGRPSTRSTFQFAGDASRLSPEARTLIASQRWTERRGRQKPETAPQYRSITSGAEVSANRGAYNADRRFDGERGWYNPNAAANGGSGTSPKNPWA